MFNFTPSEKRAISITILIIIGAGVIQYFQPYVERKDQYDYKVSDSIFTRLSLQVKHAENLDREEDAPQGKFRYFGIQKEYPSSKERNEQRNKLSAESINLNRASNHELQGLPHIGPTIARRIIEYRDRIGGFKSIDELLEVKGIGKKTLKKIRPFLKI